MWRWWSMCFTVAQNWSVKMLCHQVYWEIVFSSNSRYNPFKVSTVWLPKYGMNRENTNRHATLDIEGLQKSQYYAKKYRKMCKLKARELAFSREEYANCLSIAKWSSLKAWIQLILYKLNKLYLEICVCLCVKYI